MDFEAMNCIVTTKIKTMRTKIKKMNMKMKTVATKMKTEETKECGEQISQKETVQEHKKTTMMISLHCICAS